MVGCKYLWLFHLTSQHFPLIVYGIVGSVTLEFMTAASVLARSWAAYFRIFWATVGISYPTSWIQLGIGFGSPYISLDFTALIV
jgi:hypothetical protein